MQFSAPLHDATPEHGFPIFSFSFDRILVHKKVQFGGNHTTGASFLSLPINLARRRVRKGRLLRAVVCHKNRLFSFFKKYYEWMSLRIFSFFRKSETHRIWRCSFLSVLFSVQQVRLPRNGGAGGAKIRNLPHLVPFSQFGGRYEYGLAARQFCLFVACLACFLSLANAKWLGWIEICGRGTRKRKMMEPSRFFLPILQQRPSGQKGVEEASSLSFQEQFWGVWERETLCAALCKENIFTLFPFAHGIKKR